MAKKSAKKAQKSTAKVKTKGRTVAKKAKKAKRAEAAEKPTPEQQELIDSVSFLVDKTPFTFDLNGHFTDNDNSDLPVAQQNYEDIVERLAEHIRSYIGLFSVRRSRNKATDEMFGITKAYTALIEGQPDLELVHGSCLMTCYHCGEEVEFLVNLKTRHVVIQDKCRYAGGIGDYTVSFDVPSGKLVFANDLREFYKKANDNYDINRTIGCKRTTESYAANGLFHAFVGNTCPGIYQKGDRLSIGSPRYDEESDTDGTYEKGRKETVEHGKRLGGICTDLWWFGAADHDDLKKRAGKEFSKLVKDHNSTVVKVTPGHYRLTARNHTLHRENYRAECARQEIWRLERALDPAERKKAAKESADKHRHRSYLGITELALLPKDELRARLEVAKKVNEVEKAKAPKFELRAVIERVGDCTGVNKHALAEAKNQEAPSFEDYVKLCRLGYPDLYPTRESVLEHTFLVIGNGLDWNNGTLWSTSETMEGARAKLNEGADASFEKDAEKKLRYYPISKSYSAIFTVPDDVKHDWLAGAFEACQMVFRLDPNYKDEFSDNAANIALAQEAYGLLCERFEEKEKIVKENPDGTIEMRRIGHYREELDPVWSWLQSRITYPEMVAKFRAKGWTPENGRPK